MTVVLTWVGPGGTQWNDDDLARFEHRLDEPLPCVLGLIGQRRLGGNVLEQNVSPFKVVRLSGRAVKSGRVAQRIHCGVNLGAQPPTAAPKSLILRRPLLPLSYAGGREQ
jgi:hypothetical protein